MAVSIWSLLARCLLLAALASASIACSVQWYATPLPKPEGLGTMGLLLQWMAFLCLWFGFRALKPLRWITGGLVLFPLAQATVHWVAAEMGLARDFVGWSGFQSMLFLHAIVSCGLCAAACVLFLILRWVGGLRADAFGP